MKVSNIDGWPGYYINKSGRLYSNKRGKWTRIRGELCNNRIQYRLYKRINIDLLGNKKHSWGIDTSTSRWFKASRLVAMAYIPNPNNYPVVCHKDNNPLNNHVSNLYWGTQKMNIQQAVREKRFTQFAKRGKENPMYGKRGKLSPFYGIPRSSETKKLISIANKGRKVKEDTKLKISNTIKSLKRGKTVPLRYDIIKLRYEDKLSQSAIAEILGLHQTAISKFLRNYEHSKE